MPRFASLAVLLVAATAVLAVDVVPDTWAYRRPKRPEVPTSKTQVPNPIDAFLLAKLEPVGRGFAPAAEKGTWLRRVTFDLTGLPPTPEELTAFLKDESPSVYEKVVDRLLASSRFGERQAVWWLDVVRYAESDGFKADDPRPNAWRYRDYVIQSFNADKRYDRFVKEQLAGDELFPGDPNAVVATGFLRHYPDEYNAVNLENRRQEILNDITDTTAATFLGLTIGCAKCHDHKTDPVPQSDYYRLQAFFAGFFPDDKPLADPDADKRKEWEAQTAELRAAIAAMEDPLRKDETGRRLKRFPDEYARIFDIPESKRTPMERQIGAMVEKQIYEGRQDWAKKMKGEQKTQYEGMTKRMAELEKEKPPTAPTAMAMTEVGPVPPPTHLLKRGDWRKLGDEIAPGFLTSFDDRDADVTPTKATSGRRSALAGWLTTPDHPLTARVFVNRVWQQMFGRGLVGSPNDFGVTGDRPSHPELLDWLAADFAANGWQVKRLFRQIALTAAYRQSASGDPAPNDPENKLLARFPRKRLDGETIRDAMLFTAGVLNPKAGGPSVYPELPPGVPANGWKPTTDAAERNRRSVYVAVKRNQRFPFFSLFDSPDRNETCGRRFATTTAPQALTLLNDAVVLKLAGTLSERVRKVDADPDRVIDRVYQFALSRTPTTEERAALRTFLTNHKLPFADAVTDVCHAVLNLNEFVYVD